MSRILLTPMPIRALSNSDQDELVEWVFLDLTNCRMHSDGVAG